jgi:hypothetical protein
MYILAFPTLFPVSLLPSTSNWQIASPVFCCWNGHLSAWLTIHYESVPSYCVTTINWQKSVTHSTSSPVYLDCLIGTTSAVLPSTEPVNYTAVVPDTPATDMPHTVGNDFWICWAISWSTFCMNSLCSRHAYGIQWASWLDLGPCDHGNTPSNCTLI